MGTGKQVFVQNLVIGSDQEAPFLVLNLTRGRTSRGNPYLNVELGDRTGRIQAKVWEGAESLAGQLAEGTVVLVRGYVDSYRGAPQLVIREARSLDPADFDWADYLKVASRPVGEMKADLWALINDLPDDDFRRLTTAALKSPRVEPRFYESAAAKNFHHAHTHGLLEHSLSVGRLAARAAGHYPHLNFSLLVAGAVLHDLGKIWELSLPPRVDYTTAGRLKGHLVMGADYLAEAAAGLPDFPPAKLELLQHLILSHHGEPEFGAAVKPQIMEALVLHHLDNIDAKVEAMGSFLDQETDGQGWSPYHRLMGAYFYRPPDFPESLGRPEAEPPEPEKPLVMEKPPEPEAPDKGRLF
ncbi:MAG: HD domain-containing protein [Candidatus Adiutrix sp.]|jgi:3'-5' exoribonuclease|nr:HD domain-containing protein [Candidatus Adiutrix sp.]